MNQITTARGQGRGPGLYDEQQQRKRQEKLLRHRAAGDRPALFATEDR